MEQHRIQFISAYNELQVTCEDIACRHLASYCE